MTHSIGRSSALIKLLMSALFLFVPMLAMSGGNATIAGASAQLPGSTGKLSDTAQTLVLHVYFRSTAERDSLATELSAEELPTTGGFLTVMSTRDEYNTLLARGLRVEIDEAQTENVNSFKWSNDPSTFYGGFKTVEEEGVFLNQEAAAYPGLATVVDIGDSWCKVNPGCIHPAAYNGYDILALHITNQAITGTKPVFWYDAGIHSREIATSEIAMRLISYLLDNYATDADAHWLVDYQDIWIIPMLNPDGHHIVESGGGGSSPYYQRKNSNNTNGCTTWPPTTSNQFGTDNNRNFPFLWNCCGGSSSSPCNQTYHGTGGASDPETQAVINQVRLLIPDQRGPNITDAAPLTATGVVQSMHSNGSLNLYPWGFQSGASPNNTELANIGKHMQAANAFPSGNGYQACASPNCLYAVDGDTDDWAYGELGAASYTTEIGGNDFFVPIGTVDSSLWPTNKGALLYEAKIARTPYLTTHGPDSRTLATTPMTVTQGVTSALTATINFAWTGNTLSQNVGAAEYYVDTPSWAGGTAIAMSATDGNFNSPTEAVQATVDTSALAPGRHILFVRGRGATDFSGFQTWGPVSAVFLDVLAGGTPTATPSGTPPTATSTTVPTNTATHTLVPTNTPTNVPTNTSTTAPTNTATTAPTNTATTAPTDTATTVPTNTSTTVPTNTATTAPTQTPGGATATTAPSNTPVPTHTATTIPTNTTQPTNTNTLTPAPTQTPGGPTATTVPTDTTLPTATATHSPEATATSTVCPLLFTDVSPDNTFYQYIRCLACRGIVSGYTSGCDTGNPCFRPANNVTRGQVAKIVSNAAGFADAVSGAIFEDVPEGSTFYDFVARLVERDIASGYPCGGAGEPCGTGNLPYFRPNASITRGQLTKIVSNAAGFTDTPGAQLFEDVLPGSTFYDFVERLASRGFMTGYPCGRPTEPCGPNNLPYFRPADNASRGQTSKIVANTFLPACDTP